MRPECGLELSSTWRLVLFITLATSGASANDVERQAKMTTCELVRDFGYSCETSSVTTDDGYILEVDRVGRRGKNNTSSSEDSSRGIPVLLVPGILCESGIWFLNFLSQSPGFLLADHGYDVWAMNTREIAFRSRHLYLSQKDDRYWQWSFNEIGRYDVAAFIDLIINITGVAKLPLLVFSQGFTASLALLSTRPEYNDKVEILMAYAPVGYLTHVGYPLRLLIPFAGPLRLLLDPGLDSGYIHIPSALERLLQSLCAFVGGTLCSLPLTLTLLDSAQQINKTRIPVYLPHVLVGTSIQDLIHYVQVYRKKNLQMYDYRILENIKQYGQVKPPVYPLERIALPVALFSSEGDTVADKADVSHLVERLGPRILFNHIVPPTDFRHADFIISYHATGFLHKLMIDTLDSRYGK